MRLVEGRGPIAQRLVDGVLERAGSRVNADDFRPHEAHAVDIRCLALHVPGAHVDHAIEIHECAREGGRSAVLAGASLCDDALLPHFLSQQGLADHLVGLVSAAVNKIFPFEKDPRVIVALGEVSRLSQWRRAAKVVAEQSAVFGHELLVVPRVDESLLKLVEGRQKRFSDELSAKFTEVCRQDCASAVARVCGVSHEESLNIERCSVMEISDPFEGGA